MTERCKTVTVKLLTTNVGCIFRFPTGRMTSIILTSFGTNEAVRDTSRFIAKHVGASFPDASLQRIHLPRMTGPNYGGGNELVKLLNADPPPANGPMVVQPLLLTPGSEFHQLAKIVSTVRYNACISMPLLSSPLDFRRVARSLQPLLAQDKQTVTVLIGHGTTHPSWTIFPALEQIIEEETGLPVLVAALQHYPPPETVIDRIIASGYQHALIVPLLLTTGTHYRRDIAGPQHPSWAGRLRRLGIRVTLHEQGLGTLPGIADLFVDHIGTMLDRLADRSTITR